MAFSLDLIKRHYSEANLSGFTAVDGVVAFYSQIHALLTAQSRVLDFGAGRGAHISEDPVPYRRRLQMLRGLVNHVEGCDLDAAVSQNQSLDSWKVIKQGAALPYESASFDLIISRSVFEHIEFPDFLSSELGRVLKPGGTIAVMTPNRFGYVAVATRLVPNRMHASVLKSVQPDRKAEDVFPTFYRLNSASTVRRFFGTGFTVFSFSVWAEPYYHFNIPIVFKLIKLLHNYAPDIFAPTLCMFIVKDETFAT